MSRRRRPAEEPGPGTTDFRGLWLLAGAWLCALWPPPWPVALGLLVACALLLGLLLRHRHARPGATPWFTGPLLLILAALAMLGTNLGHTPCTLPDDDGQQLRVQLELTDQPRPTGQGRVAGPATLSAYLQDGQWISCPQPVYLTLGTELPDWAATVRLIATLHRAEDSGSFAWWVRADSAAQVTAWHTPGAADHLKERFAALLQSMPAEGRALLPGMLYGDRSGQDRALDEAMKVSGLSHLTAVSGSNVALLATLLLVLLRLGGVPRAPTVLLTIAGLLLFAGFVGPDPSVLRATLMGALAAAALWAGRGRGSLGILCTTGTVLLLLDRQLASQPAFALSVLATAGIITLSPVLSPALGRVLPAPLAQATAICLAAQLICLPVVVGLNAGFSLYALPANLLAAPLLPLITVLGLVALVLCSAAPWLAFLPAWLAAWGAQAIGQLAHLASALPGATRPWPQGSAGTVLAAGIAAAFAVLVLAARMAEHQQVRRLAAGLLAGLLVFVAALVLPATLLVPPAPPEHWDLAMCDVGQGDGLVVRVGPEAGWLIDAGPLDGDITGCLSRLGIGQLPLVFITHQDNDHFGGVAELEASGVSIGRRLVSAGFPEGLWPGAEPLTPGQGGAQGDVEYTVIGPDPAQVRGAQPNDISLVLRFSFATEAGPIDFFTAGDMEEQAMSRLLSAHPQPHAAIVKASHHGARNGGVELLEATTPQLLLVSVGAQNSYGHPNPQILAAATERGARVLRTDQLGTVLLTIDGSGIGTSSLGAPVR